MRVVAYLRVSTDRQAEKGLGLDVQRRAIAAWAREHGYKIMGWYTDAGVSGSNELDCREALPDAVGELADGRADGFVVYRLDRLARDLILQETLLRELGAVGAVFSTMPAEQAVIGDDPEDPARRLIRQVLGAVAEYERSLIMLRLRNGRRRKYELGGYAYGSPPLGVRSDGGVLVSVPGEAAAVARILELRQGGATVREIIETLTAEGVPTKRGGRWQQTTVRRVLARASANDEDRLSRGLPVPGGPGACDRCAHLTLWHGEHGRYRGRPCRVTGCRCTAFAEPARVA
jgi:DNA invertase Pin-like site-specific DNA recombinase